MSSTSIFESCDLNVWPEYPEVRYWSDLSYTPAKRPFYAFCHPDVAGFAAQHRRRRELRAAPRPERTPAEIEEDRRWCEEQQYWWDVAAAKEHSEPGESAGDGGEGEGALLGSPLKLATAAMTRLLTSATTLVVTVREGAPRVIEVIFGAIGLALQICYIALWVLYAGLVLFGMVYAFVTKYIIPLIWDDEPLEGWY